MIGFSFLKIYKMNTIAEIPLILMTEIFQHSKDTIYRMAKSEICALIFGVNLIFCWGLADIPAWIFKGLTMN